VLKQGSLTITDFFTNLKATWEELDNFHPLTPCNCQARLYHEQDFIIHFLKGLDDRFHVVQSQILLMDPLPSVNRVFSMVIQNERQHVVAASPLDAPNEFANNIDSKVSSSVKTTDICLSIGETHDGGGVQQPKSTKVCVYYRRIRHTVDVCYSKHGYPLGHPRYPGRPRFHNPNNGSSSGYSSVNYTITTDDQISLPQHSGPQQHGSTLNFNQAQYQHLLSLPQQALGTTNSNDSQPPTWANLIQQGPSNFSGPNGNMSFIFPNVTSQTSHVFSLNSLNNSSSWIVDSGATDHISCSLKNFQVFSKIEPISIHLPNGAIVTSHYSGTVHFAPDFIIYNVLHVPDFRFNLFSISKFLSSHNHKLTFAGFLCQIQEVSTMKMVGLAKLQQGLYHLVTQDNSSLTPYLSSFNHISLSTINNNNLWHFRLGHFSDKRLNVLHE